MIRPLHDQVFVKRDSEGEERSPGGIVIPDTARTPLTRGIVVAVGPGRWRKNGTCQPILVWAGQRVMFTKWQETEVEVDGAKLLVIREDDLLAVMEDE